MEFIKKIREGIAGIGSRKPFIKAGTIIAVISLIVLIFAGSYFFVSRQKNQANFQYAEAYRLVAEKISQSALIKINLPKGITPEAAKTAITFDPPLEGRWIDEPAAGAFAQTAFGASDDANESVTFKPNEALKLNYHYSLALDLGSGKTVRAEFLSVEDPRIDAIFPKPDLDAPEDTKISIIFNRPMVALTALNEAAKISVPVEIIPAAEGRFKWISTNTLQFIPKERLSRSTNYTVSVGSGLVSLDGLPVAGAETHFKTRVLRYLNPEPENNPQAIYNEPIRIYFNQPVDLEKTAKEITLTDNDAKNSVEFTARYKRADKNTGVTQNQPVIGDRAQVGGGNRIASLFVPFFASIADSIKSLIGGGADNSGDDKSVIEIILKADKYGRTNFWNLENNYRIAVKKAYPLEGDINLESEIDIDFKTTGIVKSIGEANGRTSYAGQDLFDPQGQLEVNFYEPVDIDSSAISADAPITNIGYGEKCSDPEFSLNDFNCQKVPDQQTLKISFKAENITPSQTINLNLEKVVNVSKEKINADPVKKNIQVYRPLDFRVGSSNLSRLAICSNNPLDAPETAGFKDEIKTDKPYDIFSFSQSYRITGNAKGASCADGEFETDIGAGFMPQTEYSLNINLKDVFGGAAQKTAVIATGPMQNAYVNIFPMQKDLSVTSPKNRVLTFGAKNITYADVTVCKLSAYNFKHAYDGTQNYGTIDLSRCVEQKSRRIDLPQRFWVNNYFDIDVGDYFASPVGSYAIVITNPLFTYDNGKQSKEISFINVTNLAAAQKTIDPVHDLGSGETVLSGEQLENLENLYWVSDIASLEPVAQASVKMYSESGSVIAESTTDSQGVAKMKPAAGVDATVVEYNGDSTVVAGYQNRLGWGDYAGNVKKIYIYTDKPLYHPGDQVNVKGIMRLGYDGNYQMFPRQEAELEIRNPRYDMISTKTVAVNDFGAFVADIALDANAPLGGYQVCVKGTYSCGYFNLREYVPAAFQVSAKSDKDEYVSKDNIEIGIDAAYYFGVPLDSGQVEYTVSAQNYYFDRYRDGYLNFGYFEECQYNYCYGDRFIKRGAAVLNKDGKATITEGVDLQAMLNDNGNANSKIVVFDITVKNALGQSVSVQKSVLVHAGEFYLGVSADPSFAAKSETVNVGVKATDIQGKPKDAGSVSLEVFKTEWVYAKRLEVGGNYVYDWEKKRNSVKKIAMDNAGNGSYNASFALGEAGEYEIDATGTDKRNNRVFSRGYIYVHGEGSVSFRPFEDNSLTLKAERTDLGVGDEGEMVIESPYEKAKALIAVERGKIFEYQIVDVTGGLYDYKFSAREEYAPNVYVSVLLQSSDPSVKFGTQEFTIDSAKNKLSLDISSDKQTYQPGEDVILKIRAADYRNNPASAEVSVAVVDLSVLALEGNPKKDPSVFFYGGFPLTVSTSSNVKSVLVKTEIPAQTKGGSGGGGDEGAKARGVFKETAYWNGSVVTDENGNAEIRFKLPDNLTTWQTEALGVDKNTRLGVSYIDFMTKKDLMVVPLKPRFILPGDAFSVGAQVFNQSKNKVNLNVSFVSDTLKFTGKSPINLSLKAGETKTLYFAASAPENITEGAHTFTVGASGGGLDDAVSLSIPIRPRLTYETAASSNYSTADKMTEVIYIPQNVTPDAGGLTVGSSATLAVYLSGSLNYLIAYPYGCSEQVASRLKSFAVVKAALGVDNVADKLKLKTVAANGKEYTIDELIAVGLASIYNNQSYDGCFGVWDNNVSNFYATMTVVDALSSLKASGAGVNNDALNRGADCLYQEFAKLSKDLAPDQVIASGGVLLRTGKYKDSGVVLAALRSIANNKSLVSDHLSNQSLAGLAVAFAGKNNDNYAETINTVLDNRINIDSRGAFLEPNSNQFFDYYETAVGDTSLYLKSLALGKRNTELNERVVRWLLGSRDKNGGWGSTKNTADAVDAFAAYLNWTKETQANFTLDTILNGQGIDAYAFGGPTVLDQRTSDVPMSKLKTNEYNYLDFEKKDANPINAGRVYYDMSLKYYLSGVAAPRDEGISVTRNFYASSDDKNATPLTSAKAGDVFREHLEIVVPRDRRFVVLEDYIPAGMEIVDMELATEQKSLRFTEKEVKYPQFYPDYTELRDDRAFATRSYLEAGTYEYDYYVRALVKGKYLQLPALAYEMYNPENFGRTGSSYFEVK